MLQVDKLDNFEECVLSLPPEDVLQFISELFATYCSKHAGLHVPSDYISLSVNAMQHLQSVGRKNVLYELSRGLGTMRDDGLDSQFPATRMPMGLLQYMIQVFNATSVQQVCQCISWLGILHYAWLLYSPN